MSASEIVITMQGYVVTDPNMIFYKIIGTNIYHDAQLWNVPHLCNSCIETTENKLGTYSLLGK